MGELAVLVGVEVVEGANSIVRGVGLGANGEENEENEKTGRPDHTSFRCCKINNNDKQIIKNHICSVACIIFILLASTSSCVVIVLPRYYSSTSSYESYILRVFFTFFFSDSQQAGLNCGSKSSVLSVGACLLQYNFLYDQD